MKAFQLLLLCFLIALGNAKIADKEEGSGDADYFYDDDDDDDHHHHDSFGFEGSGEEQEDEDDASLNVQLVSKAKENESKNNDITFEDEHPNIDIGGENGSKKEDDDDLLYEYYNEYYEEEYDDDKNDEDEEEGDKDGQVHVLIIEDEGAAESPFFKMSYLYIMMASAILSFVLVLLSVILCRRWRMERRRKQIAQSRQGGPYFLPSNPADSFKSHGGPIVKNYQRVPSKEPTSYLTATTAVNMNAKYEAAGGDEDASQKRLLDRLYT